MNPHRKQIKIAVCNTKGKIINGSCLPQCFQLQGWQLDCRRFPCTWHCLVFAAVNLCDPCFHFTQLFITFLSTNKKLILNVFRVFALDISTSTSQNQDKVKYIRVCSAIKKFKNKKNHLLLVQSHDLCNTL